MPPRKNSAPRHKSDMGRLTHWLAALLPALLIGFVSLIEPQPVRAMRDLVFDGFIRLSPRHYDPQVPVRVVAIDDASLTRLGQWPWPRTVMADLTGRLSEAGAAAIVFDILFAEPDRYGVDAFLSRLVPEDKRHDLSTRLAGLPSPDQSFAQTLSKAPSVLGFVGTQQAGTPLLASKGGLAVAGADSNPAVPGFAGALPALATLDTAARGRGALNMTPDRDLIVRQVPTLLRVGNRLHPALAVEALRIAQDASTIIAKTADASGEKSLLGSRSGFVALKVGEIEIPIEANGALRLHHAGQKPERIISAIDLLEGRIDNSHIAGRIVLIGATASALGDIRATPLEPTVPGVILHAEAIEQVLSGISLARPDYATGLEILLMLLLALLLGLFFGRGRPVLEGAAACTALTMLAGAAWLAFSRHGLLFDPLMPASSLLLGFILTSLLAWRRTESERSFIRNAFARYVSPDVVAEVADNPGALALGGSTRIVTVLFADIANFTTRSETMPAEAVLRFLNQIHTPLTQIVMERRGTIDKYMGDGLMAFWNAPLDDPDHVRNALMAALAMRETIALLDLESDNVTPLPVGLRIGLHCGPASVGNIGSDQRFDYSAIGDTVNCAARLEPLAKELGVSILVSPDIVEAAPDFAFLPLADITLRGRSRPMLVQALHGGPDIGASEAFKTFSHLHADVLACRDSSQRDEAIARALAHPEGQAYAAFYSRLATGAP